ncbi:unnamed protein product [Amoebophrya sp. A120]|nr:unnamed protein product [Amoebophrya sp. A120]|eukprot:GSA120T00010948001.1
MPDNFESPQRLPPGLGLEREEECARVAQLLVEYGGPMSIATLLDSIELRFRARFGETMTMSPFELLADLTSKKLVSRSGDAVTAMQSRSGDFVLFVSCVHTVLQEAEKTCVSSNAIADLWAQYQSDPKYEHRFPFLSSFLRRHGFSCLDTALQNLCEVEMVSSAKMADQNDRSPHETEPARAINATPSKRTTTSSGVMKIAYRLATDPRSAATVSARSDAVLLKGDEKVVPASSNAFETSDALQGNTTPPQFFSPPSVQEEIVNLYTNGTTVARLGRERDDQAWLRPGASQKAAQDCWERRDTKSERPAISAAKSPAWYQRELASPADLASDPAHHTTDVPADLLSDPGTLRRALEILAIVNNQVAPAPPTASTATTASMQGRLWEELYQASTNNATWSTSLTNAKPDDVNYHGALHRNGNRGGAFSPPTSSYYNNYGGGKPGSSSSWNNYNTGGRMNRGLSWQQHQYNNNFGAAKNSATSATLATEQIMASSTNKDKLQYATPQKNSSGPGGNTTSRCTEVLSVSGLRRTSENGFPGGNEELADRPVFTPTLLVPQGDVAEYATKLAVVSPHNLAEQNVKSASRDSHDQEAIVNETSGRALRTGGYSTGGTTNPGMQRLAMETQRFVLSREQKSCTVEEAAREPGIKAAWKAIGRVPLWKLVKQFPADIQVQQKQQVDGSWRIFAAKADCEDEEKSGSEGGTTKKPDAGHTCAASTSVANPAAAAVDAEN